jgi:uncharacterized protein YndB with AHSA1/START domain
MTQIRSDTIRHSVVVNAPLERAFRVFTERFGDFKPREHNLLGAPIAETVFEARVGGHIYDRGEDGTLCNWATIVAYEQPHRVVFTWNIGPTWQLESDPARCSEVEVRFVPESADRTRVELEHRHIDRHGEGWVSVASGVGGDGGWPLYLSRYLDLVGRGQ